MNNNRQFSAFSTQVNSPLPYGRGSLRSRLNSGKGLGQVLLVLAILAVGVGGFLWLKSSKEKPEKVVREFPGPLVETQTVALEDVEMRVAGFGTVQAKVSLDLIPEVSGRVVAIHPQFAKGGFFKKDEPLVVIDPSNYELNVCKAQAAVERSKVKLEQEQAEGEVARHEWELLNPGEEPSSPLVLRVPHIRQAEAELAGAQAQLDEAKLDLERTTLSLPFDGRIIEESVEVGQYISFGKTVAKVYGTEVMEIPVPLEDHQLAWFDVPRENGFNGQDGAEAIVRTRFGGSELEWAGRIVRTQGVVDPTSRMVHVVVEISQSSGQAQSLLPGMFVEIEIFGKTLLNVFALPNRALRNGNQVWVNASDKLMIRDVTIARRTKVVCYVSKGLETGDKIIVSSINSVTDGMKVRINQEVVGSINEK